MSFKNLTPFDTVFYKALNLEHQLIASVAMRTDYRLVPAAEPQDEHGRHVFEAQIIDEELRPLCMEDEFFLDGADSDHAPQQAQTKRESDLAPFKIKTDVIVHGAAYAPADSDASEEGFETRLMVLSPHLIHGKAPLIDKRIRVMPPRLMSLANDMKEWVLEATAYQRDEHGQICVPLRWEHTYGGTLYAEHQAIDYEETNPLGTGFVTTEYLDALHGQGQDLIQLKVPQLVSSEQSWLADEMAAYIKSCDEKAPHPWREAQGYGIVSRTWQPRLALAGTYDEARVATEEPRLPADFDFMYWNNAPTDQQVAELSTDASFLLENLSPHGTIHFRLPGHRAFILMNPREGLYFTHPLYIETCIIDTEAMEVSLTWRGNWLFPDEQFPKEARFEIDPDMPLIKFVSPESLSGEHE